MVFKGEWGLFIHIPKCGGLYIKRRLFEKYGDWTCIGSVYRKTLEHEDINGVHGNADGLEGDKWTVIRDPLMWLRSYWTTMNQNDWSWGEFPDELAEMIGGEKIDDFGDWLLHICANRPGVVGDIYDWYISDDVKVYRLEEPDLFEYLESNNYVYHASTDKPLLKKWMFHLVNEYEFDTYERYYR